MHSNLPSFLNFRHHTAPMAMYESKEYRSLVKKMDADSKLGAIEDRYQRMHYLVQRRAQELSYFGAFVLEQCAQHERAHRKSANMAHYFNSRANMLYEKHQLGASLLSAFEKGELLDCWNKALCCMPVNWNDWTVTKPILELYISRAQYELEVGLLESATSDLMHASSVLIYFNHRDAMFVHFEEGDSELLVSMVLLKAKLLDQAAGEPERTLQRVLQKYELAGVEGILKKVDSRQKIEAIFDEIITLDAICKSSRKGKLSGEVLPGVNYNISDKLQLRSTEFGGRTFVTGADIGPEEKLLQERAQSVVIFSEHLYTHCNNCYREIRTFWPCSHCTEMGFCSARCAMLAFAGYHRQECGIFGLLLGPNNHYSMAHTYRQYSSFGLEMTTNCEDEEMAISKGTKEPFKMADFFAADTLRTKPMRKLEKTEKRLLLRAMSSLLSHRGKHHASRENNHTAQAVSLVYCLVYKGLLKREIVHEQGAYSRLLEQVATTMLRICTNGFCWAEQVEHAEDDESSGTRLTKVGSCLSLVASFVNHSCHANVNWTISEEAIVQFSALRPIKEGEPLSICYGPKRNSPFNSRQARLLNDYCFFCQCEVFRLSYSGTS